MLVKRLSKVLSANDRGIGGGHQGGIYVPKNWVEFFPPPAEKGGSCPLAFVDLEGNEYVFQWRHYASKDEYHLTHMEGFYKRSGATTGDTIVLEVPMPPDADAMRTVWSEGRVGSPQADPATKEGEMVLRLVRSYERSPAHRQKAIELHGHRCFGCEVLLEEVYGPPAAGFIHIHHAIPVSRIGKDYRLDVRRDLVPLCPNCHAVAHRRDPPYTVEELRQLLREARGDQSRGNPRPSLADASNEEPPCS